MIEQTRHLLHRDLTPFNEMTIANEKPLFVSNQTKMNGSFEKRFPISPQVELVEPIENQIKTASVL